MNENKGAIAWMARDKITPNLLMLFLIIGGLFVTWGIKKEIMPEFNVDRIEVAVSYSGATPEEIDLSIVLPVENAIRGIEGIDEINSTSVSGSASITIKVMEGYDANQMLQEIDQAVNRLTTLPEESEKPRISVKSRKREVMEIMIYGDVDKRILRTLAENVRDRLLQDPGLTQIELDMEPGHEIQISIDQDQLQRYELTLGEVSEAISQQAFDQTSGEINAIGGDISVRVQERREQVDTFRDVPIKSMTSGSTLKLGDIATLSHEFDDDGMEARYNGQLAAGLTVYRVGEQTPIGVSDTVRNILPEIRAELPPGVSIDITDDDSVNFRNQMNLLLKNAFLGLLLVLVLLSLFLEYRLAFWVTMGIPTSFLGAMLLLPGMDVSINIISMFAFIIALGIVVDDAIIAGENIYHRRQEGMSFSRAAILGARDVAVPLTFSILTNMVAFLPILTLPGMLGKLQQATPLVVISVFAISWIEALFILPAHLGQTKDRPKGKAGQWLDSVQQSTNKRLMSFINTRYKPALNSILNHKYLSLSVALAIVVLVGAWQASGRLGFYLMPRTDASFVRVIATLPYGSPDSKIRETLAIIEAGAQKLARENGGDKLVSGLTTIIENEVIRVSLNLTAPDVRPINTAEVARLWRRANGEMNGLLSITYTTTGHGPGGDPALTVELSHSDTEVLSQASEFLSRQLQQFSGVTDISSSFASGNPQLDIRISQEGMAMGLTADDISKQLRNALFGVTAIKQQEGRNEVSVKVMLNEALRQSEADLLNMMIRTDDGNYIPLTRVATVDHSIAPSTVIRRDGNRTVDITAEVNPRGSTPQIISSLQKNVFDELLAKYPGLQIDLGGDQKRAAKSMSALLKSSLLAMLLIYALLAIPFQSFTQPLLVMAAIPFGLVGAFLGHMILGYTLSMISFMGVIALCGVVVNDSLILLTTYNKHRKDGKDWREAINKAATRRFRPIILTTLTTFGGLAPMIFETSREAQMLIPMAISLGFGILFATFITLAIIPCLIGVGHDIKSRFKWEAGQAY
ncbi:MULTISPECIES: efflux RND transporter permease subunit [unclassified Endozoicomonas]|uniref:efflux RND transporter permease subunit n=1 Tax=unclassified Endozoicomonas TaxID=2644528 RepID=UPI003BB50D21